MTDLWFQSFVEPACHIRAVSAAHTVYEDLLLIITPRSPHACHCVLFCLCFVFLSWKELMTRICCSYQNISHWLDTRLYVKLHVWTCGNVTNFSLWALLCFFSIYPLKRFSFKLTHLSTGCCSHTAVDEWKIIKTEMALKEWFRFCKYVHLPS